MASINWYQRAEEAKLTIRNFIDGQYQEVSG